MNLKLCSAVVTFAPKIDLDAQRDFWMHFGCFLASFWHPFGFILAAFGSIVMPLGSMLAPFGLLFCTFSLHFHDFFLFFNLFLLFIHLDCLRFRFWSHFEGKCNFWAPNPAGNPQQNYRRISTVGTPPFLGPGRVCCRRQLKIRPGPEAPEACWASALACALPITHPTSEEFLWRWFSAVPSQGDARKVRYFGTDAVLKNSCVFAVSLFFRTLFSHRFLDGFLMDFTSLFGSLFNVFSMIFASIFRACFCIDFWCGV